MRCVSWRRRRHICTHTRNEDDENDGFRHASIDEVRDDAQTRSRRGRGRTDGWIGLFLREAFEWTANRRIWIAGDY